MMRRWMAFVLCVSVIGLSVACGSPKEATSKERDMNISSELTYSHSMETVYAEKFSIDYYEDGYALLTIADGSRFLVVPEEMDAPADLMEDIMILQKPVENVYLVASAVMDMFVSLDALAMLRFSGLKADGWYIEEAREAVESGELLYAGNYAAPDYEQIVSKGCDLAIENTMISHNPEVKEQLERLQIPVLVDYSSYETEPLGRTEWVKLYGLLAGKEAEAEQAFQAEMDAVNSFSDEESSGQTVAFFYITTNGEANVRKSTDYLPRMIEMAGGSYIFEELGAEEENASSTVTMQMEEFYASAKEADYIIYNSAIEGELSSVEELVAKSSLLENCKAVQEGKVYCTTKNLYQSSMALGTMIQDIHKMLSGEEDGFTYLYRLN